MKKVLFLLFITVIAVGLMSGCASKPDGDPKKVVDDYYQALVDGNYEKAYDCFTSEDKKQFTLAEFVDFQEVGAKSSALKSFKSTLDKVEESGYKSKLGIEYKNAASFSVSYTVIAYDDDKKEVPSSYKRYVVDDAGAWKLCRDLTKQQFVQIRCDAYSQRAWMFYNGKGVEKNNVEALSVIKSGLSINPQDGGLLYVAGVVYEALGRYDEARSSLLSCVSAMGGASPTKEQKEQQSNAFNAIGCTYQSQSDFKNAKQYYSKALEMNPDNEYARNNLKQLQ